MFETFSIKFHNREAFNTAVSILMNKDCDAYFVDVGHADMIMSFEYKNVLYYFVTKLPFSSEHFTINQ